ncbi:NsdA OS=Streptomyces griseomycini OX=66895 GN=FHS37_006357 PE=4 SV=1 [Streptomyces griseomycini]
MSGNGGGGTNAAGAEKRPNELLASWFVRSGWSKGELARQVNRRARQLGANHLSTDTSRVRRWLDGENPREPIPRILSELFSERFGVVVSVEDLGLRTARPAPSATGVDLPWTGPQTVALLSEFSRSDLMWRGAASSGARGTSPGPAPRAPLARPGTAARPAAPEPVLSSGRPGWCSPSSRPP